MFLSLLLVFGLQEALDVSILHLVVDLMMGLTVIDSGCVRVEFCGRSGDAKIKSENVRFGFCYRRYIRSHFQHCCSNNAP